MTLESDAKFEGLENNMRLVVWKITWEICKVFTRVLECLKIGTLMESIYPK